MLYFVIPAYNEEKNISSLLESIGKKMDTSRLPYKLIVVNDGSVDKTVEIVRSYEGRYPVTMLTHATNKNVGQVFRTAFDHILGQAKTGDLIITKEADNTSDLGILDAMIARIGEGYDLALASCYAKGGKIIGTTFDRIFLSSMANLMLRVFFPIKNVRTYSSFYRVIKIEALKKAYNIYGDKLIEEVGFACMVELLVKLSRVPVKIAEVPMVLRCDLRKDSSKKNKTQTIFAYFGLFKKHLSGKLIKKPEARQ